MISDDIQLLVQKTLKELKLPSDTVQVSLTNDAAHGEYATNTALILAKKLQTKPIELANKITQQLMAKKPDYLEKIEIAGPGFINFFISKKYLLTVLYDIRREGERYGTTKEKAKDIVFIEHSQPNTNKPLHIGHLRNAVLGMSLVHLFGTAYQTIESTNINNDRGIANIKGMWAYLFFGKNLQSIYDPAESLHYTWKDLVEEWWSNKTAWKTPSSPEFEKPGKGDYFIGKFYVVADGMGEHKEVGEKVKKDWTEMLQAWENEGDSYHERIFKLWEVLNAWFYVGSRKTMNRLGVVFTLPEEYESKLYMNGKRHIEEALKKGIPQVVKLKDGAIQAKLESFGLPDKILVRRDGTAIYMTFDVELTRKRVQELNMDKGIWVVGSDQELYFKQLFAVCEILGLATREKLHHFSYGMVRLTSGKLSSRKGRVIYADDVLDAAVAAAKQLVDENEALSLVTPEEKQQIAEIVGVGAVKYAMLKLDPKSEILFDIENSVSLQGNSGPYLQYAALRAQSVLNKAKQDIQKVAIVQDVELEDSEVKILRTLLKYQEVVRNAVEKYAPHDICTYLFLLAQEFNGFYASSSILNASENKRPLKLALTGAVRQVLHNGLGLLGIDIPSHM